MCTFFFEGRKYGGGNEDGQWDSGAERTKVKLTTMARRNKKDDKIRRDKNVIRTRNSKNLDTKNQQLDTRCNENSTKQK